MNYSPPSALLLCLHTRYNLFAHSSCTSLFILLFIKSTVYCIAHFILLHILLLIFPSYFYFICTYIYIYSLVLCFIFLHCPLSGPVLTYISLLIISCIIEYVTNKRTLNLEPVWGICGVPGGCSRACSGWSGSPQSPLESPFRSLRFIHYPFLYERAFTFAINITYCIKNKQSSPAHI